MSGMLAGVMAVSYSAVYQMPADAAVTVSIKEFTEPVEMYVTYVDHDKWARAEVENAELTNAWRGKTVKQFFAAVSNVNLPVQDFYELVTNNGTKVNVSAGDFYRRLYVQTTEETYYYFPRADSDCECSELKPFNSSGALGVSSSVNEFGRNEEIVSIGVMISTRTKVVEESEGAYEHYGDVEAINNLSTDTKLTLKFSEYEHTEKFDLSEGGNFSLMMPEYGRFTDKSEIIIKAEAPASLTQDGETDGETETAKNVFRVIINNDWNDPIVCPYVPGQTEYTLTVDSSRIDGNTVVLINNPNNEEISFTVGINGYTKDSRSTETFSAMSSNITMTVEKPEWVNNTTRVEYYNDSQELMTKWQGKTIGKLREAVGRFAMPAQNYISDSAGAGADVPVFPDYRDAATKKLPFDIQITEDKRSALALPGKTGTVYMHAYTDSDYAEGALADGETSLGNIDGVTYGTTTIQDLVDRYKSFTLPEIPFYSSSVEGLTRDLLQYKVIFRVKDTDGRITATYADMDIDLDGADIPTGALLPGSIVSAYGSCTIADIALSVSAKTEKNSDGKEVTICEAVRNMQPGGEIAIELTQDTRASVTISAPQGDMEMYVCNSDENSDISGWCEGGWAFSDIVYYPDNVVSGETTVGDLKKMYNVINVSAPKYESDTEDIGSSGFVYNINIKTKSGDDYSGDEVDYDSAGTFYIDRILENAADDLVIDDICLRISSRMETNPDTGKQQAVSEKIRSMKDGTTFLIVNEDPREVLNVSVNANKVTLTAYDDGDGSGVNVRGSISAGNDAIGMTLADFFAKYKEINFAAPGYVSDSIGAGKDAFKAIVNIRAAAPDSAVDFVRLNWVVFQLDEGGWHSIKMYEDYFLPDYKDYTIDSIDVEFVSTVDDDGKAVSEKIRSLNIGDEVTVTLKSSERKVYSFDSLSAKNATIEYKGSGNESKVDLYVTDSPLIGMTVAEMVDAYIGCQMKAPGYYGDTANAGKDAFSYKMNILALAPGVSEGDYSNMCWLDWVSQPLDQDSNVSFEKVYGSFIAEHADYKIVDVYVSVMVACDENQIPASSVIRGLEEGTPITIEFVKDDRKTGSVPTVSGDLDMHILHGDWIDGGWAYGGFPVSIDGIELNKTTVGDVLDGYKSFETTGLAYNGDSENIGKEYFKYYISFVLSDGSVYNGASFNFDKGGKFTIDAMSPNGKNTLLSEADRSLTITGINVRVESKTGWNNDTRKMYSLSDKIKAMNDGDGFTVYANEPTAIAKPAFTAEAGNASVKLSWEAVPTATDYYIYSYLGDGQYMFYGTTKATSFTVNGLTNGQTYQFLVRAFNAAEGSPYDLSDLVPATPQ